MKKYIALLILFAAIEISLALYLTYWREEFWTAVSTKQSAVFAHDLMTFTIAALAICVVSGISGYLVNLSTIEWRKKLNDKAFLCKDTTIENFNQRQQQDAWDYPDLMLNLSYGGVKAVMYIVVFSVSLIASFGWGYLVAITLYCLGGTAITHWVAKPLVALNYEQQRAEATYRNNLTIENFGDCVRLMLGIAKKTKRLSYSQVFIGQLGVIVPLLLIAPAYFTTGMTLGTLMRFNSVAGTIVDNLTFGVSQFGLINRLRSCKLRLKEGKII